MNLLTTRNFFSLHTLSLHPSPLTSTLLQLDFDVDIYYPINIAKNVYSKFAGKKLDSCDNMFLLFLIRAFSHYFLVKLEDVPSYIYVMLSTFIALEKQNDIEFLD